MLTRKGDEKPDKMNGTWKAYWKKSNMKNTIMANLNYKSNLINSMGAMGMLIYMYASEPRISCSWADKLQLVLEFWTSKNQWRNKELSFRLWNQNETNYLFGKTAFAVNSYCWSCYAYNVRFPVVVHHLCYTIVPENYYYFFGKFLNQI